MEYAVISNLGDRERNEDCADGRIAENGNAQYGCFVLADGLGGHGRGEVASQLVVGTTIHLFESMGKVTNMKEFISQALDVSQKELMRIQKEAKAYDEMKTTAVVLVITDTNLCWAHVGDSRLYYFHNKKLVCRTEDHSVPQILVSAGEIKEKAMRRHPDRNKLLRVMGTEWSEPKYVISDSIVRGKNQAFLLCSDGYWENINEKEMQKCLKKAHDAHEWLSMMSKIVAKRGEGTSMDNHTALVVMV